MLIESHKYVISFLLSIVRFDYRAVAKYLQTLFDREPANGRRVLAMDHLLTGKTRKEASRMFFETLVCFYFTKHKKIFMLKEKIHVVPFYNDVANFDFSGTEIKRFHPCRTGKPLGQY